MTWPLFGDTPPGRHGAVRRALDRTIAAALERGAELAEDVATITRSLADRIDAADASGDRRGYALVTAEYRQYRNELFADAGPAAGADPFAAALDAFRAAAGDDTAGPVEAV